MPTLVSGHVPAERISGGVRAAAKPSKGAAMRDGTLESITGRDEFIIAEALATALVALEELPPARQPKRNIADMRMLLNSLYPPSDVSIHLTTARWRFLPSLRPLGAR